MAASSLGPGRLDEQESVERDRVHPTGGEPDPQTQAHRILKHKLKGTRIRFTDDERRRPAVEGKALGRKVLREVASDCIVIGCFMRRRNL